jgi:hypothetical protein
MGPLEVRSASSYNDLLPTSDLSALIQGISRGAVAFACTGSSAISDHSGRHASQSHAATRPLYAPSGPRGTRAASYHPFGGALYVRCGVRCGVRGTRTGTRTRASAAESGAVSHGAVRRPIYSPVHTPVVSVLSPIVPGVAGGKPGYRGNRGICNNPLCELAQ